MRVGGPAERILVAETSDDLVRMAQQLWDEDEHWILLGGGSNTVIGDDGFPGTVLLVRNTGIERVDEAGAGIPERAAADGTALPEGTVRLRVQAGHDWDELVAVCVEHGWSGIEALSGIPGLAGAAPVQNIGAYGQELSDVLHSITFLDRESGEVLRLPASELELGYRSSAIKSGREGVVLSIDLLLAEDEDRDNPLSAPIAYGQLADALGVTIGDRVSIRELRRSVLRLRASKGMVLDAEDHDTWSAGSFFTNPIVSESFARTLPVEAPRFPVPGVEPEPAVTPLEDLAAGLPLRVPDPAPERLIKLSAAWLIENAGIEKGFRLPGSGAAISSKHTLAITNRGAANAADVAELARYVVQRVQAEFGVLLVPEPNLIGLEL
ncbi:UDP-N-acetylmuramate dehydrogenase [Leucobacter sp. CSA1]|uniref:UDP-N-acetylenolpyruvoylglucosamine reductase n=2 Tax=Leucobacter chromiisoli TaxID=2796471 RepID=A0A934Q3S0_9MICO|nr:UDP-N-acetylmuramate dehydrogenase [Leucobacter chromiisoli]